MKKTITKTPRGRFEEKTSTKKPQ